MTDRIRVAVVDDHPLFREGVVSALEAGKDFTIVAQGASASDAISIARKHRPDLMIVDLGMPGNGITAARTIATEQPSVKVVILTVSESQDSVTAALEAGARGYVLKGVGGHELCETLRAIQFGESYVSPALAARMLMELQRRPKVSDRAVEASELTAREEEVLEAVSNGYTNKEIAIQLQISEKTVKQHMTSIMQKLQVRNRVEAVMHLQGRRAIPV